MMGSDIVQEVWDDNPLSPKQINYLIETSRIRLAARTDVVELYNPGTYVEYFNATRLVCCYQALRRGPGRYAVYGHVEGYDEWYHVGWIEQS